MSAEALKDRLAELDAMAERQRSYTARAWRITDRLLPELFDRVPHGFYHSEAFVASGVRKFWRRRLSYYLAAKIRAKAEGGIAQVEIPRDCEHIFRPGNALYDVSKYLEAQAAA